MEAVALMWTSSTVNPPKQGVKGDYRAGWMSQPSLCKILIASTKSMSSIWSGRSRFWNCAPQAIPRTVHDERPRRTSPLGLVRLYIEETPISRTRARSAGKGWKVVNCSISYTYYTAKLEKCIPLSCQVSVKSSLSATKHNNKHDKKTNKYHGGP